MIVLVGIALILVFGLFPYLLSRLVTGASTRPMDRRLTQTPADLGATYTDVSFRTSDGVEISGWLLPGRERHVTIVYSHGLFRSRRELLERAVDLWRLGYGALLYDSRNHGESGPARVSLGYFERLDVEAAVRYLRETVHTEDKIGLYGISMGAAGALMAAAETPEVSAVISDSSFLSFRNTVNHHVNQFLKLPAFPIGIEIRYLIEQRDGFDGDLLDPLKAVNRVECPIFFIAGAEDKRMPPSIAEQLRAASRNPRSDLLIVEGATTRVHGHSYQAEPELYVRKIDEFLKTAVGG